MLSCTAGDPVPAHSTMDAPCVCSALQINLRCCDAPLCRPLVRSTAGMAGRQPPYGAMPPPVYGGMQPWAVPPLHTLAPQPYTQGYWGNGGAAYTYQQPYGAQGAYHPQQLYQQPAVEQYAAYGEDEWQQAFWEDSEPYAPDPVPRSNVAVGSDPTAARAAADAVNTAAGPLNEQRGWGNSAQLPPAGGGRHAGGAGGGGRGGRGRGSNSAATPGSGAAAGPAADGQEQGVHVPAGQDAAGGGSAQDGGGTAGRGRGTARGGNTAGRGRGRGGRGRGAQQAAQGQLRATLRSNAGVPRPDEDVLVGADFETSSSKLWSMTARKT